MNQIKAMTTIELMQEYSRITGKFCLYISIWGDEGYDEAIKAAPYLSLDKHMKILVDGHGIFAFNTEEEMMHCYNMTIGDDGPTESNNYNGPCRIYALTCVQGFLEHENT